MKKIDALLIVLALSFYGRIIGQISVSEPETSAKVDPYFIESRDTVSLYGPNCITRDVLQDSHGNYWLATWKGIIRYDGKTFTNFTLKEGLIHFHVSLCYEDKKGHLWFGTVRGGIYRYDPALPDGKAFTLFTTRDGLIDNSVNAIAEDTTGNLWLGTDLGASRYDGQTFTNFTVKDGLCGNAVSSILCDKAGKLWLGCRSTSYMGKDGGLCYYNGKSFTGFPDKDTLAHKNITSLIEDKNRVIWMGTFSGLIHYDGQHFLTVNDLPPYLVYYIIEDKKGTIWLSSAEPNPNYNRAIQSLYNYDGKIFSRIIEKRELGDNQVFGKIADRNGDIWFGTLKGVYRYDGKSIIGFTK